ncbi:MAG: CoA-binding protein [Candidatus Kryptoniota bacterium]
MTAFQNPDDRTIKQILKEAKTIAVVGASSNPARDSYRIMSYLMKNGYNVIPVNPNYEEVLGQKCFPTVESIGKPVDIVDVFRRSEAVNETAQDAIRAGAKVLWLQLWVINNDAAHFALKSGLKVIMDRCIMVEHQRLFH